MIIRKKMNKKNINSKNKFKKSNKKKKTPILNSIKTTPLNKQKTILNRPKTISVNKIVMIILSIIIIGSVIYLTIHFLTHGSKVITPTPTPTPTPEPNPEPIIPTIPTQSIIPTIPQNGVNIQVVATIIGVIVGCMIFLFIIYYLGVIISYVPIRVQKYLGYRVIEEEQIASTNIELSNCYTKYFNEILKYIENNNIFLDQEAFEELYNNINTEMSSRTFKIIPTVQKPYNIKKLICLYYKDTNINIVYKAINKTLTNKCVSEGLWSKYPIVNLYKCDVHFNNTNKHFNIYRCGTRISLNSEYSFEKDLINNFNNLKTLINNNSNIKKTICFSLLTPNNYIENTRYIASKFDKRVKISNIENDILQYELGNCSEDFIVISFPLSSNYKMGVKLFDYDKLKKEAEESKIYSEDIKKILKEFYDLIDISNAKTTLISIIKVIDLFNREYYTDYNLAFHCKSGKDRTSIFDCIVQATLHNYNQDISSNKSIEDNIYFIKQFSRRFLLFGYLIGYYGSGYFGLKLGSNKELSQYIFTDGDKFLEEQYKFYLGDSGQT